MTLVGYPEEGLPPAAEQQAAGPAATDRPTPSAAALQALLLARLSQVLNLPPERIDVETPLLSYGLDSLAAVSLTGELEEWLGQPVPPTLTWDYPTIAALATYLAGEQPAPVTGGELVDQEIPAELYDVELFPEYQHLRARLDQLERAGLENPYFRVHQSAAGSSAQIDGRRLVNFANYNYLGLSGDPRVTAATQAAVERYGTSAAASRVSAGELELHGELERELADFVGTEACLVFVGGYGTNLSTIGHLLRPGDLILHDALTHNSILQGAELSGAARRSFPHNDWLTLDGLLAELRPGYARVLIVLEAVYSADGDLPDLPRFVEVKRRHKALLMVDEAHSIGVLGERGRGIGEHYGVEPAAVDIWMGTLSKALASCGGYIAGRRPLIEYLKYTAGGFVFSVGISPPNAAAALAALRLLRAEPERVARLRQRAGLFRAAASQQGLDIGRSQDSAIVPLMVGDSLQAIRLSQLLFERGINVQPLVAPAVDNDAARLRFFLACTHTEAEITSTVEAVSAALAEVSPADAQTSLSRSGRAQR